MLLDPTDRSYLLGIYAFEKYLDDTRDFYVGWCTANWRYMSQAPGNLQPIHLAAALAVELMISDKRLHGIMLSELKKDRVQHQIHYDHCARYFVDESGI